MADRSNRMLSTIWLIAISVSATARAAEPTVRAVDVRGLRIGATTTLTIDGTDLLPDPRLLLPFEAQVELKSEPAPQANRVVVAVTLGEDVTPGVYPLRVVTAGGVSAPVVVGVDRLPQSPLAAKTEALPAALSGSVSGSNVVETTFAGKAGQEVTVEVEAARLGGALRPVLHLYDADRLQLAWAWPTPTLHGDSRLTATLPADGDYTIALHDAEYAAPNPNHFRLKVGAWSCADLVFPPVVQRGTSRPVEVIGRGSAAVPVSASADGAGTWLPLDWPDPATASGLRPAVRIVDTPELIEQAAADAPQPLPHARVALSGRLSTPGETDRYRLDATPGAKLRFELFAARLGSPLDTVLVLSDEAGKQLARGEDGPETTDAILEFTVPANTSAVTLAVSDLHGQGSERSVYRLTIDPSPPAAANGFRLFTTEDRLQPAAGSPTLLPVYAERHGYDGPIALTAVGLPPGKAIGGAEIPPGADGVLLTVNADASATGASLVAISGASADGAARRITEIEGHPLGALQPWLATKIAMAVTPSSAFRVEWAAPSESAADASLVPAGQLPLPVRVIRPEGEATPVRLTLLTSQIVPRANNGQPDRNKSIREERAVEIPADKTEGEFVALVPPELSSRVYDLAMKAELLSKDKRTVLATAYTPVRRTPVVNPIGLELAGSPQLSAVLDAKTGATVKLTGRIIRRAGFAGEATVTLEGLPGGARAAAVTVKADATDFELPVTFPANFQLGDVTGATLVATVAPDAKQPNVKVRSAPIALMFTLTTPSP